MNYVYLIRSISDPSQIYIGATADLKQRIADHNAGKSAHTSKFAPWELEFYVAFPEKQTAFEFEKYLKSHSGRSFAQKRLMRLSK
jgi:putative endonuclease